MKPPVVIYTLSFLIILFSQSSLAQARFQGQVLNEQNKEPVQEVSISTNTGKQLLTDQQGRFSFTDTTQNIALTFRHFAYQTKTIKLTAPVAGELQILLQAKTDSLQEVIVTGYASRRSLLETAGAISLIDNKVLHRFDESSLVRAINTVPGVRMEERAPASYRLSIRGSSLRSPYGIRNVKVYLHEVPLTGAKGTTDLHLLDPENIRSLEILKGPAGSLYGAGTGGTLLISPKRAKEGELQLQASHLVGSFGLQRSAFTASNGGEKSNMLIQYTRQTYNGHREQSAMDRKVLLLSSEFYPSSKQTLTAFLLYSDLYYELPGGLTQEQYDQNPRQARGGPVGSVLQNASMHLDKINAGVSHEYKITGQFKNTTSLYGLFGFQDHPFNTDYERNTMQEYGGRTRFTYDLFWGQSLATFTAGAEFQQGFEAARTYDNNRGTPATLRTDDEVTALTGFVFGQAEIKLPGDWISTAALSLNDTRYHILRLHEVMSSDTYRYNRHFKAVVSPRLALLKRINQTVSVHGSISGGFSPPTEEEILTSNGQFNQELEAEKGLNYEAGIRGHLLNGRLAFDLAGFSLHMRETIVSRQDTSSVAVFRNAGATLQNGVESHIHYALINKPSGIFSQLNMWGSYTFNHFRFEEYQKNNLELSGNRLTGVAPHMATVGLDMQSTHGFYLHLTANYVAAIPLTDENTVFSQPYLVSGTRLGYRKKLNKEWIIDLFAGADNLADKKYSLGNDLNAFGGRYFQPAPPRNYFGGIRLSYLRSKT